MKSNPILHKWRVSIFAATPLMVLLLSGQQISFADTTAHNVLSECTPSEADPCANIVDQKLKPRFTGKKIERPMGLHKEKASGNVGESGIVPEAKTNASPLASDEDQRSSDKAAATMKVVVKNYTRYPSYWRMQVVRGGTPYYWPSPTRYYTVRAYANSSVTIKCNRGETVFWGAGSTNGVYYWGWGEDFDQRCTGGYCRITCGYGTISIPMR
jgi:hypothetical protein